MVDWGGGGSLAGKDSALLPTWATHRQQDPAALVNVGHAEHRDAFRMPWLIGIAPGRRKGRLQGIGEVHLEPAQFLVLAIAIHSDLGQAGLLIGDLGNVLDVAHRCFRLHRALW